MLCAVRSVAHLRALLPAVEHLLELDQPGAVGVNVLKDAAARLAVLGVLVLVVAVRA